MITLKTETELEAMREAGGVVAAALNAVQAHAGVGVSLKELDEVAATVIAEAGAKSSFLHYQPSWAPKPYPGVICASVNDAVTHAIPDSYRLREGDLLSIDCGAHLDGWHGDAAITVPIGAASAADQALMETAVHALTAGIEQAQVGARLGDVSHAIGEVGRKAGYGLPRGFGGHGIGHEMHEEPFVHNEGRAGRGMRLRAGLVLALEPMLIASGRDAVYTAADGWAVHSADGSRAVHMEHTVAITDDGPEVLTLPS